MTRAQIESTYGVRIADDSFWWNGRTVKQYRLYTADGCQWENGLRTIKAVEQECKTWAKELLSIKEKAHR